MASNSARQDVPKCASVALGNVAEKGFVVTDGKVFGLGVLVVEI